MTFLKVSLEVLVESVNWKFSKIYAEQKLEIFKLPFPSVNWSKLGEKDESILSVLTPDLEHVPNLIWLFPEGRTQKELDLKKNEDTFGVNLNFKV